MMDEQNQGVYAPVIAENRRYEQRKIVSDQVNDPIDDEAEEAIAAMKGHIERQDMEGTDGAVDLSANNPESVPFTKAPVNAKENYKLDNSHISVKQEQ